MSSPPPRAAVLSVLSLSLVMLVLCGCTGRAPRHGAITFHDPSPGQSGLMKQRRVRPYTVSYQSLDESALGEDGRDQDAPGIISSTGSRGWDPQRRLEGEVHTSGKIRAGNAKRIAPIPMTEDGFASLWAALEDADLFTLPPFGSSTPPDDRAYFLLEDTKSDRRWIFPRPTRLNADSLKTWAQAKRILVMGSSIR